MVLFRERGVVPRRTNLVVMVEREAAREAAPQQLLEALGTAHARLLLRRADHEVRDATRARRAVLAARRVAHDRRQEVLVAQLGNRRERGDRIVLREDARADTRDGGREARERPENEECRVSGEDSVERDRGDDAASPRIDSKNEDAISLHRKSLRERRFHRERARET